MGKNNLKLRTFRYGDSPKRGEGLRIGTTRRPPRGVPTNRWVRDGYFDVWFPVVAPSAALLRRVNGRKWNTRSFYTSYERELLGHSEGRQAVQLLAALALRTPISIGCFCSDEKKCHRSHLKTLIERTARKLCHYK